jgi:alkanesulfonate monooxygenase SsuD/methylene tetrahydromethanopterin reductase-like flavin-dependent oxidoreductase (luciferase family)
MMYQEEHILPHVLPHFDSVWIADHFYGFDKEKTEGFLEGWVALTWLAAKFPDVMLCHHVLGHGYRNPALIAKMSATLQVLSGGRFILGIGGGWREDEYRSYGYDFPSTAVRLRQLEEVVQICRLMWTEPHPTFAGKYFQIDDGRGDTSPRHRAAGLHRQLRRTDRSADRRAPSRHLERQLQDRRGLEAQARHRRRCCGRGRSGSFRHHELRDGCG